MAQNNNEAASALHSAIVNLPIPGAPKIPADAGVMLAYKLGHGDARRAAAELVAASASPSSTAGAAKGGVTCPDCHGVGTYLGNDGGYSDDSCNTCDGSGLAHVARQRQESPFGYFHELLSAEGKPTGVWLGCPNRKATEQAHIDGETGREIITLYAEAPTPSAAVAEGVDTAGIDNADFSRLLLAWHDARVNRPNGRTDVSAEANAIIAYAVAYGAQQREAGYATGFLHGQEKVEVFRQRALKAEAALARQPVSEGLTPERIEDIMNLAHSWAQASYAKACGRSFDDIDAIKARMRAILSAVPPAKAEGLNDEAVHAEMRRRNANWNATGNSRDSAVSLAIESCRAILAQQAKKGGAA